MNVTMETAIYLRANNRMLTETNSTGKNESVLLKIQFYLSTARKCSSGTIRDEVWPHLWGDLASVLSSRLS